MSIVLDTILETSQVLNAVDDDMLVLVTEAHFRGASWAEIARRLDRSKQSVHQRYQARIHSRRTRELLSGDLADALQRARLVCHYAPPGEDVQEARSFLHEWTSVRA